MERLELIDQEQKVRDLSKEEKSLVDPFARFECSFRKINSREIDDETLFRDAMSSNYARNELKSEKNQEDFPLETSKEDGKSKKSELKSNCEVEYLEDGTKRLNLCT